MRLLTGLSDFLSELPGGMSDTEPGHQAEGLSGKRGRSLGLITTRRLIRPSAGFELCR